MLFSLVVLAAPYSNQSSNTAFEFAKAVLASGHKIHRVFFYGDGIHNASSLSAPPRDERNLPSEWKQLAEREKIDMVVCIAAALRRGLMNEEESKRYEKTGSNLMDNFEISGLGQLLEAAVVSDRIITFGN
jgi:tRNA 2-thiouridine synthesizing protein D